MQRQISLTQGMTMKGSVLVVLHPAHGHATAKIRGTIYEAGLNREGWRVNYVSISSNRFAPELDPYRKSQKEIIAISGKYDIIYLLKVNSFSFIKKLRRQTQARIVFDLTDALWRPGFRKSWIFLEEILRISDAVFIENEYVGEYARRHNRHVFSLPACTQTEKFDEMRSETTRRPDGKVRIGWIGSDATIQSVFKIIRPLERLFAKYPQVELRLLGCNDRILKDRLNNLSYSVLSTYSEADMIREALMMDIGIFPPPSDIEDYRIRGALKGMIYMSAGIPAVCINAGDCSSLIQDGINGVLINKEEEWESKIEKLIVDPAFRVSMGERAYESIKADHSLEKVGHELSQAFDSVLNIQSEAADIRIQLFQKLKIIFLTIISKLRIWQNY